MKTVTKKFLGIGLGLMLFFVLASSCFAASDFDARRQEIVNRWNAVKPTYNGAVYDVAPSIRSPYAIGKVAEGYLADGLRVFNFARFLAGLPDDVTISEELTDLAQHGAVVLAATGTLTHWPTKPADMEQSFFDKGYQSTTSSNLSQGSQTIPDSIYGCLYDGHNELNLSTVGHRRWILSPLLKNAAFGVAGDGYNRYIGHQVFDESRVGYTVPNYIAWPSGAAFPNSFMEATAPWSVQLNAQKYQSPSLENVSVTLTRQSDGKAWSFSKTHNNFSLENRYFNVNSDGYGGWEVPYCVIFRPEGINTYSGEYSVSITGLRNASGNATSLEYTVAFFDMPLENATIVPVTSVALSRSTLDLSVGANATLNATILPSNATTKDVTWSSSDSSVAMVDTNGKVTAIAVGTTVVNVKTLDGGFTANCIVTVSESGGSDDNSNDGGDSGGGCNTGLTGMAIIAGIGYMLSRKRGSI